MFTQWRRNEFESGGGERPDFFFGRGPPLFGSTSTNIVFDERFRDGQCSVVTFSFAVLLLTVLHVPRH